MHLVMADRQSANCHVIKGLDLLGGIEYGLHIAGGSMFRDGYCGCLTVMAQQQPLVNGCLNGHMIQDVGKLWCSFRCGVLG